jgi:hypothetical protein
MKVTALLFKNESGDAAYVVEVFSGTPTKEEITQAMESVYAHDSGEHWVQELKLKQRNIATLLSDGDHRHALYVDGKLVEDGSDTDVKSVLDNYELQWEYIYPNEDWLEEVLFTNGVWPQNLKDVVLD